MMMIIIMTPVMNDNDLDDNDYREQYTRFE